MSTYTLSGLSWPEFLIVLVVAFPFTGLVLLLVASVISEGWEWILARAEIRDHQIRWSRLQRDMVNSKHRRDSYHFLPSSLDSAAQRQYLSDKERPEVHRWQILVGYLALLALGGLFLIAADHFTR